MARKFICLTYLLIYSVKLCENKYVEGEINTSDNWAFIARFCFLSQKGQFEFYIEFNEDQGDPNLLLYYDDDDQWPMVYKTNKTCYQKESVLHVDKNQLMNLTTKFPYREAAGCIIPPQIKTTPRTTYMLKVPTVPMRFKPAKTTSKSNTNVYTNTESTFVMTSDASTTDEYFSTFSTTESSTGRAEELMETPMENGTISNDINFENILDVSNTTDDFSSTSATFTSSKKAPIRKRAYAPGKLNYNNNLRQGRTIICRNARTFSSARERWWFVAISNCKGNKGIHIKYRILMTNGPPGDYWHEHFSADEFYVLPVLMAFSIAYSFLILAIVICSVELKSRQLLHSTYKLFVLSVFIQFMGIVFQSMAYLKYAVNGVGTPNLKMFGSMFMGMSETCFLLLLLLIAKGYTVTRGRLPLAAGVKLTIFMCLYVVTYISLFIYEAKVFDPGEVLYIYESPAGYGLIILRILAWCMFIYSTVFTLKHYPEKANFYYPFNIFGTLWFIAGPAFILSANSYIDKWVRESIVCAILLFITFGGHLMFLLLTMPSVANKNFPYHVRTTQIGVMEVTGNIGNSTMEQFSHNVYEPTSNIEQTVIVPLTRRTEEIFGGLYSQHLHTTLKNGQNRAIDDGGTDGHTLRHGTDMIMENVLSWSLAKSFSPLEASQFDRVIRSNLGSAHSGNTEISERLEDNNRLQIPSNNNLSYSSRQNGIDDQGLNDWIKEVPVELFTISKMVVTKKTLAKPEDDSE